MSWACSTLLHPLSAGCSRRLRDAKHIRQYRELTDDCLQRHQYEFPGSHSGWRFGGLAAGRQRRLRKLPCDDHRSGRDPDARQSGTNIAVNGDGFFIVQHPTSFTGNTPIFDGVVSYTRRGDFELNANGYLVNGAGYYLEGIPIDQTTGAPIGNVPSPCSSIITFCRRMRPRRSTMASTFRRRRRRRRIHSAIPNSELLNPANFTQDPTVAGTGQVIGSDVSSFCQRIDRWWVGHGL